MLIPHGRIKLTALQGLRVARSIISACHSRRLIHIPGSIETLRPLPCGVIDTENHDAAVDDMVRDDVRGTVDNELPSAVDPTGTANTRLVSNQFRPFSDV